MNNYKLKAKMATALCALLLASALPAGIFAAEDKQADTNATAATETAKTPVAAPKEAAPNYEGTVYFLGQWTDESTNKKDSTKTFHAATDKLGDPLPNPGLYRGAAKTFLGWSDKAPVNNGELAEGARLFSKEDTIATAFPNGISEGAKLYGVYFSLNEPDQPFPTDTFGMGFAIMGGMKKIKINENKATINLDMDGNDTLPNTETVEFERDKDGNVKILDRYVKKNDLDSINEVVLKAEFKMNHAVAMLVYKNPQIGYTGTGVLTSTYKENKADGKDFSTKDGDAGYTYVDMEVSLDNKLTVPEKLYLEFKGYSWRPLYVFGANKEILPVLNPADGSALGNDKNSFNTLVNKTDPRVAFGVETKGNHKLTVRVILRDGENEKIAENSIKPENGKTIAETILENMTLRSLSSSDVKALQPTLSKEEVNKHVIRISDSVAKELADTDGTDRLSVTGEVRGMAVADAGRLSFLSSRYANKINASPANTLALGYALEKYNVIYTFISGTEGKDLPAEVIDKQPKDEFGALNNTKVALAKFEDVKVEGGTWKFKTWHTSKNDQLTAITEDPTVSGEDLILVGEWVFVKEEKPVPSEEPNKPNKPEVKPGSKATVKAAKTPKTGDERNVAAMAGILALSATALVALRKRKTVK